MLIRYDLCVCACIFLQRSSELDSMVRLECFLAFESCLKYITGYALINDPILIQVYIINQSMACRSGQKYLFAIYDLYRDANMSR